VDVPLYASMELLINLDEKEKERVNESERAREREGLGNKTDIQKDQGSGKNVSEKQDGNKPGIITVNIVLPKA